MKILTKNQKETFNLGFLLGRNCFPGEIFCLSGQLGSGKTTLSQGIAKGLGIKKNITSPTFIIYNAYKINKNSNKIKNLIHIDAYRLTGIKDLESIGFFDLLKQKDIVLIIEWGEKIKKHLSPKTIFIEIKLKKEPEEREIFIS
ncbi:MAG: tRNA (adenosine(37)-N6)-threonylcarbamoyltransferase complex ATPase subunit type 1 TsaE [Patescibacteria group bacterium]|jgi:tRNA threonylcarbamoyladenosine biosynthesis protein TsaE